MMKTEDHGMNLFTALSLTVISMVCFVFVDDIDLSVTGATRDSSGEDLLQTFQETLDRWAGGLSVTGGELAQPSHGAML